MLNSPNRYVSFELDCLHNATIHSIKDANNKNMRDVFAIQ
jgi:hypothetical protein